MKGMELDQSQNVSSVQLKNNKDNPFYFQNSLKK